MNRPRIKKATGKCLQTGPPLETKESEEVQKAKNCRRSTEQELRQIGLKWNKLEEGTLWQCSTLHRGAKGTESEGREGRVEGASKHSIKSFPLSQPHPLNPWEFVQPRSRSPIFRAELLITGASYSLSPFSLIFRTGVQFQSSYLYCL